MTAYKTLQQAFPKLNLSDTDASAYSEARVIAVGIDKQEGILRLKILSKTENSAALAALRSAVLAAFSYINDVEVTVCEDDTKNASVVSTHADKDYDNNDAQSKTGTEGAESINVPNMNEDYARVKSVWNKMIRKLGESNPFCAIILDSSIWRIESGRVVIDIDNGNAFHFNQRGINKRIENLLHDLTGVMRPVVCMGDSSGDFVQQSLFEGINDNKRTNDSFISENADEGITGITEHKVIHRQIVSAEPPVSAYSANEPIPSLKPKPPAPPEKTGKHSTIKTKGRNKKTKIKKEIEGEITALKENLNVDSEIHVIGRVIETQTKEIKAQTHESLLVTADITDGTGSVTIKFFTKQSDYQSIFKDVIKKDANIAVKGIVRDDTYSNEINIFAHEIAPLSGISIRNDNCSEKRVELHLHTQMSEMDAVTGITEYIKRAAYWGHKAVAVTDHGVVQAFPEAAAASQKYGIKVIYGIEAYLVDDIDAGRAVQNCDDDIALSDEFIAFDLETTGLDPGCSEIIEIGACRIKNNVITDEFSILVKPRNSVPYNITKLTGIDNEMLEDKPNIETALDKFLEFAGEAPLIAHNSSFDIGFLCAALKNIPGISDGNLKNPIINTLSLSRGLCPKIKKHSLEAVAEHLNVQNSEHHRALSDARTCGMIFNKLADVLRNKGITGTKGINEFITRNIPNKNLKRRHAVLLVKNLAGLRNLYELVSESHINYFYRRPRIMKSDLIKHREGLLIGSACDSGELFRAVMENASEQRIDELCRFYDYYEIQPSANTMYLVRSGVLKSETDIVRINKEIVSLGDKFGKPVCATGDAHFLEPDDAILRGIIQASKEYKDADIQPPLYFRTTDDMLKQFAYLGEDTAHRVVIENTNSIAAEIDDIKPIPDGTFPPEIEGSDDKIREMSINNAKQIYGDPLPDVISERLYRELKSIIDNGFAVMYLIAQKLVAYSEEHGYLVGSRGSVGSSFVATMTGITEVNPLSPHYVCEGCKYSDFDSDTVRAYAGGSGCDMPDMLCPKCGTPLKKDGHDIPFETFLGFEGDKEPDIDLNFSGEFQAKAHTYTEELFGAGYVFKAGTISTLADTNAFGAVKKYMESKGEKWRSAEINRFAKGCVGVKKTTGQHPGGLIVVPNGRSIYEFTPVQKPANKSASAVITTHFDYHSISGRLLKLDILGHDVPTIVRMLHDFTGIDPRSVDLGDKDVISLFTSPAALGVTEADIDCNTGTLGLPEFGTSFVRQMLAETQPQTFAEIVRISGLSHGTDVWLNNAQEYIKGGQATLKTIIPTRDDILLYLIRMGVEKKTAFWIAENVRKGKGLKPDEVKEMQKNNVPEWYIESCRKIKYLFPKGHAVAYVMMTMRIGWYKIHRPYAFYAAMFSVRALDFDYELMCFGREKIDEQIRRINALTRNDSTQKDKSALFVMELVREFYVRGLKFVQLDMYRTEAEKFIITDEGLMPPLCSVAGLGEGAAKSVIEARTDGEFKTIEDFKKRTKVNKTVTELLKRVGILGEIPETSQISLMM